MFGLVVQRREKRVCGTIVENGLDGRRTPLRIGQISVAIPGRPRSFTEGKKNLRFFY